MYIHVNFIIHTYILIWMIIIIAQTRWHAKSIRILKKVGSNTFIRTRVYQYKCVQVKLYDFYMKKYQLIIYTFTCAKFNDNLFYWTCYPKKDTDWLLEIKTCCKDWGCCKVWMDILQLQSNALVALIQTNTYARVCYRCDHDTLQSVVLRVRAQTTNHDSGAQGQHWIRWHASGFCWQLRCVFH